VTRPPANLGDSEVDGWIHPSDYNVFRVIRICSAKSPTNKRDGRCESILKEFMYNPLEEKHDIHDSMSKETYILSKEPCTLSKLACAYADGLVGRTQTQTQTYTQTRTHTH